MTISPDRSDVFDVLRAFLVDVLPDGTVVVAGMPNRVAAPKAPNYVIMSALRIMRLRTNINSPDDVRFTGSIASEVATITGAIDPERPATPNLPFRSVMTVDAVAGGVIRPGQLVAGVGIAPETYVIEQIDGTPGAVGRYRLSIEQEVVPGSSMTSSGGLMTVSDVDWGTILVGARVFGTGLAAGTRVRAIVSGTGGVGTYVVSPGQTISSGTLSAGGKLLEAGSKFVVQLDFHSYDLNAAADMAATVQAVFRDPYSYAFFDPAESGVAPLYADDPRLVPFVNENQQVESRWILEAEMQVNQTVRVQAEYADAISVEIISVDAAYPP